METFSGSSKALISATGVLLFETSSPAVFRSNSCISDLPVGSQTPVLLWKICIVSSGSLSCTVIGWKSHPSTYTDGTTLSSNRTRFSNDAVYQARALSHTFSSTCTSPLKAVSMWTTST